ncbi:MAG: MarR family winged helix-turn-helix transcriptional regulator [Oscillatoriaceae bacterium SKW80]|nr:MarR family winged helix-turn-helix transcriptional regulator [Oscillatoriaceae bacterium SKYG93]MCX8121988.1 MarR family winged helix-turn-helix transcriptional regulator [Oscillatoriaceae bacterium SKW80]MDW8454274.1 MarR family winged helix-turn-helix transcriptional regulator [Oscillatoriaceae cyanobacterium SKYGB_i_bin93]HIK29138.1 winged helix-turn-helix transcriptional regulator [Oscillatoriaceae cyanobacterium M7585_C2015_266]
MSISDHIFKPHPHAYDNRMRILNLVLSQPGLNAEEIAAMIGVTYSTVHKQTQALIGLGLIHSQPDPVNARMKRFFSGPATLETFNPRKKKSEKKRSQKKFRL